MVQQMIDSKFYEYGLANSATGFPTGDKQSLLSVKAGPSRDMQNEPWIINAKPQNCSVLKGKEILMDDSKVRGRNLPIPSSSPSSSCNLFQHCSNGSNSLVYVRRKADFEPSKSHVANIANASSQHSLNYVSNKKHEPSREESQMQEDKISHVPECTAIPATNPSSCCGEPSALHSLVKPGNEFPSPGVTTPLTSRKIVNAYTIMDSNCSTLVSRIPFPATPEDQLILIQHRQQRFDQLQVFLKDCDDSHYEEYKRMLRTLSASGRSRHAVDLEKRTIQLSLEEAKEFQKVKNLNILGKH